MRKASTALLTSLLLAAHPLTAEEPVAAAADALTPGGFVINYEARFAAFRGEFTLELLQGADDDYRIRATSRARGLARMIRGGQSVEEAHFSVADGNVISRTYKLDDSGKSAENDTEINFDWDAGIANSVYEQELAELPLEGEVYDRISADVVTMMDLRSGHEPRTLYIAEKNAIREYTFEAKGRETIDFLTGELDTVKYLRTRTGSSRPIMIWYAPELGYLPVRMEQFKHGKSQVTFTTKSYSLAEPSAAPEVLQTVSTSSAE